MNTPIRQDRRNESIDHLLEFDPVAMHKEPVEEHKTRAPLETRPLPQVKKSLSVRRIPGFRLLRLRQIKDLEKDALKLLRARQVHVLADHLDRFSARRLNLDTEVARLGFENPKVHSDARVLHVRKDLGNRKLHILQK